MTAETPSFTCPKCGMTSYNANDIRNRYCGNCHEFQSAYPIEPGEALFFLPDAQEAPEEGRGVEIPSVGESTPPDFSVAEFDPHTGCWPKEAVSEDGTVKPEYIDGIPADAPVPPHAAGGV